MNIGFVGLGKLGLPSALAVESKGHTVVGFDINPNVKKYIAEKSIPYLEKSVPDLLQNTKIQVLSLDEVLKRSELIFVAVQTPHDPMYEGITKLPSTTADFNYDFLKNVCTNISTELDKINEDRTVIVISTVLPGTIEREIKPILSKHVKLCYNPFFIAMGTTVYDFLNPEIVLFGIDDLEALEKAKTFYRTITDAPFKEMRIVNAELVKVNYNTFITMKINFANNLMEVCHKMRESGADVDVVYDALKDCTRRIISPMYMKGGMPDSGGCHPRDNIALADFARKKNLSNDLYTEQMQIRERHIAWFADMLKQYDLPKAILGKSYKPEINLTVGSSAIRLYNEFKDQGLEIEMWDPHLDGETPPPELFNSPHVYFIGTNHKAFTKLKFPAKSVVIDPFRYISKQDGVEIIGLGSA